MDDWPLAKILIQISGGKPRPVSVDQLVDVTDRRCPPFEGRMLQSRGGGPFWACRTSLWNGPVFEELSGGNWMAVGTSSPSRGLVQVPGRAWVSSLAVSGRWRRLPRPF